VYLYFGYTFIKKHEHHRLEQAERQGKNMILQEEEYWQAVQQKDMHMDGVFVYAVRSTGIYCHPSCPSRRPRREQVAFFPLPKQAEQAGFRPCRRCQPDQTTTGEAHVDLIQRVCRYIEQHLEEPLTLTVLGEQAGMSPYHLQRVFKHIMSITPHQYAEAQRLKQFKERLKEGETVTTAMYDAGYSSTSRLYERTATQLGMTPVVYQRGGHGMSIHYTIVDSPLGRLLVAGTEKGVCSVCIGEVDTNLEAALFKEYPAAEVMHDSSSILSEWVNALLEHLQGQQPHLALPIDVQATAFQWKVWKELQAIPYGETRSYGEIARALGDTKKARAVAQACATNPVALVIPCHRVVRENGEAGGYRWGRERKQQLLQQERTSTLQPIR
jgi:AraC family transcriptional regulator, regulatory protein of adaptative response / methylated-DNA-[protein]-cysteine methyltransferase